MVGDPSHIRITYTPMNPGVIRRQIKEAKNLGIYAFAVDWYGCGILFSIAHTL
jgi:hypothetical protein